jgi:asparagine synthase (glutamine-hydrolysing)
MGSERLSIVDLHERADQPFADPESGRWLVCNGEIYNAAELRRRYRDYPYRSASDVETILPLYADKGLDGLRDLDGMYAVALWDAPARALVLARDRAGEKPLFVARAGGEVWFASEVQALLLHPELSRDLDEEALLQYLTLGYVLEPRTMFREIGKVEAGCIVRFAGEDERVLRYWDPPALAATREADGSEPERLRSLLETAVEKQLTADVPIGIFVSGGLDSSLIAAIAAAKAGPGTLRTYVARFAESTYDESAWAAECSRRLGIEHREVIVDESSLTEAFAAVSENLAEPLADPAILPTWLLAREARRQVKVVLGGEGADELFGGYPTYLGHHLVPLVAALPGPARRFLHRAAGLLPASRGKVTLEFLLKRFLADVERPWFERHLAWFGTGALAALSPGLRERAAAAVPSPGAGPDGAAGAMLFDYRTYLPDDLLAKIDRATMLNALESRAPYLDRDLTAFALALPVRLKVRGLTTKWLLKKVAREWLPKDLVERRKRGLSVPVASWIDGGLAAEVDRLLDADRLRRQGFFDPPSVERLLAEHRSRRANHARALWTLIVFEKWLERWAPERAG